jgi:hypothetical protein
MESANRCGLDWAVGEVCYHYKLEQFLLVRQPGQPLPGVGGVGQARSWDPFRALEIILWS